MKASTNARRSASRPCWLRPPNLNKRPSIFLGGKVTAGERRGSFSPLAADYLTTERASLLRYRSIATPNCWPTVR